MHLIEPLGLHWDTTLGLHTATNSETSRSEDSRKIMKLSRSRTYKLCELHTSDSYPCEKEAWSTDDIA